MTTWLQRARRIIPGGVNSPVRSFKHVGGDPVYFERGEGAHLFDVDGKKYVDFCLSFGPHLLGHCPPQVVKAVQEQAAKAMSFGACHPKEVELGELILRGFPFMEQVRLVNSGTEAVMTAIRLARGFTGRNKIVQFEGCYHGHSDGLLAKAGSGVAGLSESTSKGVPPSIVADTLTASFTDITSLERLFTKFPKDIAVVVLEPIPANNGLLIPTREHLKRIIEVAHTYKALVLFDEVITGYRVGLSGAAGYFDLKPDLITLGKIVGGGLPLAALIGKKEIMGCLAPVGPVYQAGTLSGNPLACAAGCAVLESIFKEPPYADLEFTTTSFTEGLKDVLKKWGPVRIRRIASLFWLDFGEGDAFPPDINEAAKKKYADIFHRALADGIYFAPSPYEVGFLSLAHTTGVLNGVLEKMEKWK
jgi:glutamate-1-semialdehyde 2,1-aminomutase